VEVVGTVSYSYRAAEPVRAVESVSSFLVSSSEIARLGRAASQLGAVKAVEKSRNGMARKRRALFSSFPGDESIFFPSLRMIGLLIPLLVELFLSKYEPFPPALHLSMPHVG
jgi:hypothetical protein